MIGLLALGLTSLMIFTLVKNALMGKQLGKDEHYNGSIELIIPVTAKSEFYLDAWQTSFANSALTSGQVRIHVLIDGDHPSLNAWQELKSRISFLEIHSFPMRPVHVESTAWMLEQISPKIQGQIVIIGDPELVPTMSSFSSIARMITQKDRSYFIVPQTAKTNIWGEALTSLNPTLAFTSFYGVHKWPLNLTHPLLSISQGWMAMTVKNFRELDFKSVRISTWKELISRQWDEQKKSYYLAFGEKHLLRFYPETTSELISQMKKNWADLWHKKDKMGFWLYLAAVFLWCFPFVFLLTHPFWSMASFGLLVLYRFFSKIVFQESWTAIVLHPAACMAWLGSLGMFIVENVKGYNRRE
jgi:hypothetical protein